MFSCLVFLETMAPAGPMVQHTMASGLAAAIVDNCGVTSVSLGLKDSSAIIVKPCFGANFSSQPFPSFPKPSEAVIRAIFLRFCF